MSKFFGMFSMLFFRKRAAAAETSYEGLVQAALQLREQNAQDRAAVLSALKALGEENARLETVGSKLNGLGL